MRLHLQLPLHNHLIGLLLQVLILLFLHLDHDSQLDLPLLPKVNIPAHLLNPLINPQHIGPQHLQLLSQLLYLLVFIFDLIS